MNLSPKYRLGKILDNISTYDNSEDIQIKNIIDYNQKLLDKVSSSEWTDREYNCFVAGIRNALIANFNNFLEVYNTVFDLSEVEFLKEIINLLNKGVIYIDYSKESTDMIAASLTEITRKLLGFSKMPLTEREKPPFTNKNSNDDLKLYKQILEEIQDPNSSYYDLFHCTFNNWVESNFENEKLKRVLKNQESKVLEIKIRELKQNIKKLYAVNTKSYDEGEKYANSKVEKFIIHQRYRRNW